MSEEEGGGDVFKLVGFMGDMFGSRLVLVWACWDMVEGVGWGGFCHSMGHSSSGGIGRNR